MSKSKIIKRKTKSKSKIEHENANKSKSRNRSKHSITTLKSKYSKKFKTRKSSIHIPIEDNEKEIEFEDDYNLLDLTVGEARRMPEFETLFNKNCNTQLSTRMDTLLKSDISLNKYTNAEAKNYCNCCLSKLNKTKIRDVLDLNNREKLKLYDCVLDAFSSVKTRITGKKKTLHSN
jgi:hypothetical protein